MSAANGFLTAFCFVLMPASLWAQTSLGIITGSVMDNTGAVIPGAKVQITLIDRGISASVVTQPDGVFVLPEREPGVYSIRVEQSGFRGYTATNLRLDVGGRLTHDVRLEIGLVSESVSVEAVTPLLETTRGAVGDVVENKRVLEMPLNGRQVFDLVSLTPGSIRMSSSQRAGDSADMTLAGGRTRSAAVYLDGVINSRTGIGATIAELSPPVDSIGEFRVDSNAPGAELGRSSAGFVNATTKSGTNDFHGAGYYFIRNDALDSRGWDADSKTKLRRHTPGGNLGGPITRNRTFFFYNYELLREDREALRTRSVGLEKWLRGDFSGLQRSVTQAGALVGIAVPIYDPLTSNIRGGTAQFPNNVMPASRLDPVALKVAAFIPKANRQPNNPITEAGNWQRNVPVEGRRQNHLVRIDHDLTASDKLMGRYTLFSPSNDHPLADPEWGFSDPDAANNPIRQQNALLAYTRLFSPTLILNATAGFFRFFQHNQGVGFGENIPEKLGLRGVSPDVFPRFNIGGNPGINNIGATGSHNRRFAFTNFEYSGKLTKIAGSHTVRFGWDYRRYQGSEEGRQQASGVFTFNGQDTRGVTTAGAPIANTGAPMADFLLGYIHSVLVRASPTIGRRSYYTGGFVQDDWRVTQNLTLNLGIRYDYEAPFHEVADRMANFDPTVVNPAAGTNGIAPGQLGVSVFANRQGRKRNLVNPDRNNIGPRFGFAWKPAGRANTVVRGGFGVLFGGNYDGNVLQTGSQGFIRLGSANAGNTSLPYRLRDGAPSDLLQIPEEKDLTHFFGTIGSAFPQSRIDYVDQNHRTPYAYDFNFGIQHQMGAHLLEGRYLGKVGHSLNIRDLNINQIHPNNLARTDLPRDMLRPFTQFPGASDIRLNQANFYHSNYHAFAFKAEKRFSGGFAYIATYAFSKFIDNAPFVGEDNASLGDSDWYQNIYDYRSERALSNNHVPHRVVLSPIYELPFGKGKRFASSASGLVNKLISGWQISTIGTLQSGSPFGVTVLNGPRDFKGDNTTQAVLRADVVGDWSLGGRRGEAAIGQRGIQWFSPGAFAAPARFTLGNTSRAALLGPGQRNFDTSVSKMTKIGERYSLQFRWETFNSFNTAEFSNPIDQVFAPGFGTTSGGNSHREMQFALKLYF
jgi:hypothetical protein